jgi:hypothetical protein
MLGYVDRQLVTDILKTVGDLTSMSTTCRIMSSAGS